MANPNEIRFQYSTNNPPMDHSSRTTYNTQSSTNTDHVNNVTYTITMETQVTTVVSRPYQVDHETGERVHP